jgi:hypothetical protein
MPGPGSYSIDARLTKPLSFTHSKRFNSVKLQTPGPTHYIFENYHKDHIKTAIIPQSVRNLGQKIE